MRYVKWFEEVSLADVASVGGKVASLGEMIHALGPLGVEVPGGFAVTADGYRAFLAESGVEHLIRDELWGLCRDDVEDLVRRAARIRAAIEAAELPSALSAEVREAYRALCERAGSLDADVAVRSSATAEDLPDASFAGQQDTYLNVRGEAALLEHVKRCFASLFTARALGYREDMGFDHLEVALSVGVQRMVRSDLASSGVLFTLDPESGHDGVILLTSSFGLGEAVVQGLVEPDQFLVHKETLRAGFPSLVRKTISKKLKRMVYGAKGTEIEDVPHAMRSRASLSDADVLQLARWALQIEDHYSQRAGTRVPLDIEWGKDGLTGELYILQARPETVHARSTGLRVYRIESAGHEPLVTGLAVGQGVAVGKARVIKSPSEMSAFQRGEILVTEATDPDWEPIMKMAAAIVTERGGRTSHAAIVARELGIPAVLGTGDAMAKMYNVHDDLTVSCAEGETGKIYQGVLPFSVEEIDPATLPRPRTQMMLNVANPEQALAAARLPSDGVGLLRMEFLFANTVRVHPLALTRFSTLPHALMAEIDRATRGYPDKQEYFVDKLSQGIATVAAAFWPRPVVLRLSDFKSNEYASLLGGKHFEPSEENPMIGWRGASRYYHPDYKEGFLLEVAAIRRVREQLGLQNLKLMVPFCRTPAEGKQVLEVLREGGLVQGENGLEIYAMAELPSNVFLAEEFARIFDGFSIGSNDLTQLILGVDRDSGLVAPLFDERSPAVREACARIIAAAHRHGKKASICGQAPSDFPEFAAFLVEQGIDSISLNADALLGTARRVLAAEQGGHRRRLSDHGGGDVISIDRRRGQERRRVADNGIDGPRGNAVALAPEQPMSLQAALAMVEEPSATD